MKHFAKFVVEKKRFVVIAALILIIPSILGSIGTYINYDMVIPFLFLIAVGLAVLYNFGTNIFLGQILYITQSLATVLQLGVTMDFSIFLLHRYEEEKQTHPNKNEAMITAIQKTFSSIAGSSLTTVAEFLALCTMHLTLGADIGIVMAKGVIIGVICTVTILPALIMFFDRQIHKYTHRILIPQLKKTSHFVVKHHISVLAIFVLLLIPFAFHKIPSWHCGPSAALNGYIAIH